VDTAEASAAEPDDTLARLEHLLGMRETMTRQARELFKLENEKTEQLQAERKENERLIQFRGYRERPGTVSPADRP